MSSFSVKVNPKMLLWAREESGYDTEQVAEATGYTKDKIAEWEITGNLTFGQLKKIAKTYKRQTSLFFLEKEPEKIKLPQDKRNLKSTDEKLHPDIMLAVRRTSWFLEFARRAESQKTWEGAYYWLNGMEGKKRQDPAARLRNILGVSIAQQKALRSADETFRFWRNTLEQKLRVFVFQFDMPDEEIDGFSYVEDGIPFAISINKNKSGNRKVFTLFHELGHIINRQSDFCIVDVDSNQIEVELACNNFAGNFLVPKSELIRTSDSEDIFNLAKQLSVSSEVYLRRLRDEDYLSETQFYKLLSEVRKKVAGKPKKKTKGRPSQVNISKSVRGVHFFDLVLENVNSQRVSTVDAANMLGLSVQKVSEL